MRLGSRRTTRFSQGARDVETSRQALDLDQGLVVAVGTLALPPVVRVGTGPHGILSHGRLRRLPASRDGLRHGAVRRMQPAPDPRLAAHGVPAAARSRRPPIAFGQRGWKAQPGGTALNPGMAPGICARAIARASRSGEASGGRAHQAARVGGAAPRSGLPASARPRPRARRTAPPRDRRSRPITPMSCVTSITPTPRSVHRRRSKARICACTETSSAVVGSSAIDELGLADQCEGDDHPAGACRRRTRAARRRGGRPRRECRRRRASATPASGPRCPSRCRGGRARSRRAGHLPSSGD